MKIVSLNLRGFEDWDARLPRILSYLDEQKPDLLLAQEVVFLPDVSPVPQLDLLNSRAGFAHRFAAVDRLQGSKQYGPFREGLGVLSNLPVLGSESIILRHHEGDPHNRLVQFVDVAEPGAAGAGASTWLFANVHLSIRDDFALLHLEEVLGILAARGEKRIIGGDFNMNHLERHRHLWHDDYVLTTEIEQYVSFPASGQANDYFLVPREFELKSIAVSADGLSDHRALAVEIEPSRS